VLVGVLALAGVASAVGGEQQRLLNERTALHAQRIVAGAACAADLADFERPAFHNRLQRALANLGGRPIVVTAAMGSLGGSLVRLAAVSLTLVVVEPLLLGAVVVAALPLWLAGQVLGRLTFRFDIRETEADRRRSYLLGLLVLRRSAAEVRSFGLAPHLQRSLDALWAERLRRLAALARRRTLTAVGSRLLGALLVGVLLATLTWLVTSNRLGLAEAGVAAGAAYVLGQSLQAALGAVGNLYECALFLEDAEAFLRGAPATDVDVSPGPPFEGLIVEEVGFRYPGADGNALTGVSLAVRAGEFVALVGANGSGKSTLAKVLAQLYAPTSGTVRWNGRPVAPNDRAALREQIGVLFQDFERYLFTAAENIGYGRADAIGDHDRILRAAVDAGIDRRVAALPDGFASLLGPEFYGGTDLSGGEWQRVALARAFFRQAPLLILDEPTSAMDPDAEHDLIRRLRQLWAGRAVVLVSHRFSNVMDADRIVVLDAGRIVEQGTHDELMALDGRYATMFRRQAAPYQLTTGGTGRGS
jgi:ATP-binding cassette subfamily B protein